MITVSKQAKVETVKLMKQDNLSENAFIRIAVMSGGCSGLTYNITFDTEVKEEDKVFEDNGVKIVCDKKSILYINGTILSYEGGLNGKGFVFDNPNANRTCGCGDSFAV